MKAKEGELMGVNGLAHSLNNRLMIVVTLSERLEHHFDFEEDSDARALMMFRRIRESAMEAADLANKAFLIGRVA